MTRDSYQQDLLSIFRMIISPFGRIISVTFTMPIVKLFGNDQAAWIKTMGLWVVIAMALLLFCFLKCEETITTEQKKNSRKNPGIDSLKSIG
jgi:GPH family glycoside/pentoside/hexuronide:cation symporter